MERWIGKHSEVLYSVMRIVLGLLFACHGAQKLFGVMGMQNPVADPLLIAAGAIELLGGLMVSLGIWTAYAAFIASGEMAVAYFKVHAPQGFWPIANGGERAVLYCFAFFYIAAKGPGRLSIAFSRGKGPRQRG